MHNQTFTNIYIRAYFLDEVLFLTYDLKVFLSNRFKCRLAWLGQHLWVFFSFEKFLKHSMYTVAGALQRSVFSSAMLYVL